MRIAAVILALATLIGAPAHAADAAPATPTFPWKAGDQPPAVAGIMLGDTEVHVKEVLGPPASTGKMGAGTVLEYPARGLEVVVTAADGASIIRLRSAEAGSIDGFKVGDDVSEVMAKWGEPNGGGQGRVGLYNAGMWTVRVQLADSAPNIVDLMLAWNSTKWPDADNSNAEHYRPQ